MEWAGFLPSPTARSACNVATTRTIHGPHRRLQQVVGGGGDCVNRSLSLSPVPSPGPVIHRTYSIRIASFIHPRIQNIIQDKDYG